MSWTEGLFWIAIFIHQHASVLRFYPAPLPPHMKPAASSQPPPAASSGSQTMTSDLVSSEPEYSELHWEMYYSNKIPQATEVPMRLPADSSSISAQTAGRRLICSPSLRDSSLRIRVVGINALIAMRMLIFLIAM